MNNNVYVRSNKTIRTISLTRILFLLPLIIYGYYKNGISVYFRYANSSTNYSLSYLINPLILLFGSILSAVIINLLYEKIIKKSKKSIMDMIFSSFHVEYAIIIACLMPSNINFLVYFTVLSVFLLLSKFIKNRVNIMSLIFIIIYLICIYKFSFDFANTYELDPSHPIHLNLLDYLLGNYVGGIFATNVLFILIAYIGLSITNNTKSNITLYAIASYGLLIILYSLIKDINIYGLLFLNNYLFIFTYLITDSVTSCYTKNGTIIFGIAIGVLTFGLYFINPILAPHIAVLVVSLFNNLIDRRINMLKKKNI